MEACGLGQFQGRASDPQPHPDTANGVGWRWGGRRIGLGDWRDVEDVIGAGRRRGGKPTPSLGRERDGGGGVGRPGDESTCADRLTLQGLDRRVPTSSTAPSPLVADRRPTGTGLDAELDGRAVSEVHNGSADQRPRAEIDAGWRRPRVRPTTPWTNHEI